MSGAPGVAPAREFDRGAVAAVPALRLGMMRPRFGERLAVFPFDRPATRYYYLARNAVYAFARLALSGQEVLFPAYCHGVELDALAAAGATPRFYPVHEGMRVDADEVAAYATPRSKAVYLIHYLGFPGPVEQLAKLCGRRGMLLIEDCALALFSQLGGRPLGSFGHASIFCLYKTLPVPHGGALLGAGWAHASVPRSIAPPLSSTLAYLASSLSRSSGLQRGFAGELLNKARQAAQSSLAVVRVGDETFHECRANLGMSRICHSIIAAHRAADIVRRRRRNYFHLLDRLGHFASPVFSTLAEGVCPLSFPIRTRNKARLLELIAKHGIEAINFWSRTPSLIREVAFPAADTLRKTVVELPCHQDLGAEAIDWMADRVTSLRADL